VIRAIRAIRASPATALAKRVFPVPGGPTNLGVGDAFYGKQWGKMFWNMMKIDISHG